MPATISPRQAVFLMLNCHEAFYGGAAGGGKSGGLLLAALQYCDCPGYNAVIFRRTFPMLEQPRGLVMLSKEWLAGKAGADYKEREHRWYFSSGATLSLAHLEYEKHLLTYQGGGYHFIGMDEGPQFTEYMLRYMHSRLRKETGSPIPLRFRVTGNPGGPGHAWIKARYILPHGVKDRVTIRAKLEDNPYLDKESYLRSLDEMDAIDKAQMLDGNWDATRGGAVFSREKFKVFESVPGEIKKEVRYWDLAATEASAGHEPDYTVGLKMYELQPGAPVRYFIAHVVRMRGNPGQVDARMLHTAQTDGMACTVAEEQESGASGVKVVRDHAAMLAGFHHHKDKKTVGKDVRARPLATQVENGQVGIMAAEWTADFLDELEVYPDGSHDDQLDGASGAFAFLTRGGGGLLDYYQRKVDQQTTRSQEVNAATAKPIVIR